MLEKLCLLFFLCIFSARCTPFYFAINGTRVDLQSMTNTVSKSVKNVVNDIADPVVKELLATVSREFARFSLRLEFFTLATGNHLNIPIPTDGTDLEYHAIAAAATYFWIRLSSMEVVEEAITNATVEVVQNAEDLLENLNIKNETKMHLVLRLVMNRVDLALSQDPSLQHRYALSKQKFGAFFNTTRHQADFRWTPKLLPDFRRWFSVPRIKKLVINKIFLIHCTLQSATAAKNATDDERYLLARSLIRLSRDRRKRGLVQKLYRESVRATADTLVSNITDGDGDGDHASKHNGFLEQLFRYSDVITDNLFVILKDRIQSDPNLRRDIETARVSVMRRNKNVRIHRIDYWPL